MKADYGKQLFECVNEGKTMNIKLLVIRICSRIWCCECVLRFESSVVDLTSSVLYDRKNSLII